MLPDVLNWLCYLADHQKKLTAVQSIHKEVHGLVMEFLDMTLKGETFSRIVSNFCLDDLCIFTKCNDITL